MTIHNAELIRPVSDILHIESIKVPPTFCAKYRGCRKILPPGQFSDSINIQKTLVRVFSWVSISLSVSKSKLVSK